MNAISALKKAHAARAITRDTHSLKDYVAKNLNKVIEGKALATITSIESKYVPTQDKRDLPAGMEGAGNLGFRTRFILENGETIGTFSNAAHRFAEFFAVDVMGQEPEQNFIRIDVAGKIVVAFSQAALDGNRTTWEFEIVEEGSEVKGFGTYLPDFSGILQLESGEYANTETGEVTDTPDVEQAAAATATEQGAADPAADKPNSKSKK